MAPSRSQMAGSLRCRRRRCIRAVCSTCARALPCRAQVHEHDGLGCGRRSRAGEHHGSTAYTMHRCAEHPLEPHAPPTASTDICARLLQIAHGARQPSSTRWIWCSSTGGDALQARREHACGRATAPACKARAACAGCRRTLRMCRGGGA